MRGTDATVVSVGFGVGVGADLGGVDDAFVGTFGFCTGVLPTFSEAFADDSIRDRGTVVGSTIAVSDKPGIYGDADDAVANVKSRFNKESVVASRGTLSHAEDSAVSMATAMPTM